MQSVKQELDALKAQNPEMNTKGKKNLEDNISNPTMTLQSSLPLTFH